jgi:hypothetical protein
MQCKGNKGNKCLSTVVEIVLLELSLTLRTTTNNAMMSSCSESPSKTFVSYTYFHNLGCRVPVMTRGVRISN